MADYLFPTALALQTVAAENAPRMMAGREIFNIMPIAETNDDILAWEQRDNFTGLQAIRGLNGDPTRVKHTGGKRYLAEPGYYGEYEVIDERELTRRRGWGQFGGAVDATDLVLDRQEKLQARELDRQEQIGWAAIQGTYSVADGSSVLATDTWSPQTFSAGTGWSTVATATPLADLRAIQLKGRGYSVDFGPRARAYMNRTTLNNLLGNTNAGDLGGQRATNFSPLIGEAELNQRLGAAGLPAIVVYDQGYIDDTGTFQLFIPNNKVYVIGARLDGDPIMEYRITRNASLDGRPGSYSFAKADDEPPMNIRVHRGHNGGPVIYHPAAIVVASV